MSANTRAVPCAKPRAWAAAIMAGVLSASWRPRTMLPTRSSSRKRARVTTSAGRSANLMPALNAESCVVIDMSGSP